MRKTFAACALALSTLLPSAQALAWNHKGHMTVAYVAYQQLTPKERAKVFQLLRQHPDFPTISKLAGSPKGRNYQRLVFVHAARWPDLIRDDKRFFDETDKKAKPTRKLKGFPDMKKHRPWHFKDVGFSTDGTPVEDAPAGNNAEDSIRDFRQFIGSPDKSLAHRAYYLAWLEHMIGDVHQPLHCISHFTKAHPTGDAGGNLFAIAPFRIPEVNFAITNLHSFWDDVLGDDTDLASVKALAAEAEASTPAESADDLDEAGWIKESSDFAQTAAYKPLLADTNKPPTVTQDYYKAARSLALRRVKLGGRRLAGVIRQDLK